MNFQLKNNEMTRIKSSKSKSITTETQCMQKGIAEWGTGSCTKKENLNEETNTIEISCECTVLSTTTIMEGMIEVFTTANVFLIFINKLISLPKHLDRMD